MKQSLMYLTLLLFYISKACADTNFLCGGSDWVAYKDERCFKLYDEVVTHDNAEQICNNGGLRTVLFIPTLVSIKSMDEQDFLTKYVFDTYGAVDNVWIGAERLSDNGTQFIWNDGSRIDFNNWVEGSPSDDVERNCVQMQSKHARKHHGIYDSKNNTSNGKWIDVSCKKRNLVLCQKLQTWSFPQLQKAFLDVRYELYDSKNLLNNTGLQLSDTQSELLNTKNQLKDTQNEVANLKNNPVPIGFIYVQLPDQKGPSELWPGVVWGNVTPQYAGRFFRAEGGNAVPFGNGSQNDALQGHSHSINFLYKRSAVENTQANRFLSDAKGYSPSDVAIQMISDGKNGQPRTSTETRPINYTVRIWKRIG